VGALVSWSRSTRMRKKCRRREAPAAAPDRSECDAVQVGATGGRFVSLRILAAQNGGGRQSGVERARVLDLVVETLVKKSSAERKRRAPGRAALAETQLIAPAGVDESRAALASCWESARRRLGAVRQPLKLPRKRRSAGCAGCAGQSSARRRPKRRDRGGEGPRKSLDRSFYPRFMLEATPTPAARAFKRTARRAMRVGPRADIQNWGLGMSVSFPLFERYSIGREKRSSRLTSALRAPAISRSSRISSQI